LGATKKRNLTVCLFGPVTASVNGLDTPISGKKTVALLLYLCRRMGTEVPRETICAMLWPDSGEEQARGSLRQTLSVLRKSLDQGQGGFIGSSKSAATIQGDSLFVDANVFEAECGLSTDEKIALYRGDLAEGLSGVSPEFDRWLETERRVMQTRLLDYLGQVLSRRTQNSGFEDALATATRMIEIDPLQEHIHRNVMEILSAQGKFDAALRQYEKLSALLQQELGVQPDTPTRELAADIRKKRNSGTVPTTTKTQPPAQAVEDSPQAPGKASLAVLPFKVLSTSEDALFFGEGIAEDLIIELSREADLFVVARQSSFQFQDEQIGAPQIGDKLGVQFLLGGSIRLFGERVRVTTHLLRCSDGQDIWAERFDRKLDNIFDIQTEIARTVSSTVVGRITSHDVRRHSHRKLEDLKAYELVMRGTEQMHRYSEDGLKSAVDNFRAAIKHDPDYGRAYGLCAQALAYHIWLYLLEDNVDEPVSLANKAIQIDPADSKAQCALGFCCLIQRKFDQAQFHFEAGLQINPNDDLLLIEYARFLLYFGKPDDSLRRSREAMRLNPYHPNWYWNIQGRCLHTLGRYSEALAAFEAIATPPFYVNLYLAACYKKVGMEERYQEARRKVFELKPDFDLSYYTKVYPYKSKAVSDEFFETLKAVLDG